MRHAATTSKIALTLSLTAIFFAAACGTSPTPPGGPGGNANSGGAVGSSGGTSSGGGPSSGGASSSGGGSSTGGTVGASGGGPGSGGAGAAPGSGGGSGGTVPEGVYVDLAAQRQIMRGFGINATIMPGGETLPWSQLFTLEGQNALGLSILRIGMDENGGHRGVPSGWEVVRDQYDARVI